jgi:hypothetical protein
LNSNASSDASAALKASMRTKFDAFQSAKQAFKCEKCVNEHGS